MPGIQSAGIRCLLLFYSVVTLCYMAQCTTLSLSDCHVPCVLCHSVQGLQSELPARAMRSDRFSSMVTINVNLSPLLCLHIGSHRMAHPTSIEPY
jgi:hypothetical protein